MSGRDLQVYCYSVASATTHIHVYVTLLQLTVRKSKVWWLLLPRNSVHTQFYENQSCDSESKKGTHVHTYTHGMVILLILFVFILRKEIGLKMFYGKIIYRTCFWFKTSTSQNVGNVFLFAALSYAVVSMKNTSVEVVSMRNSVVNRGAFR
jgi:hypothetical protein